MSILFFQKESFLYHFKPNTLLLWGNCLWVVMTFINVMWCGISSMHGVGSVANFAKKRRVDELRHAIINCVAWLHGVTWRRFPGGYNDNTCVTVRAAKQRDAGDVVRNFQLVLLVRYNVKVCIVVFTADSLMLMCTLSCAVTILWRTAVPVLGMLLYSLWAYLYILRNGRFLTQYYRGLNPILR